jgi:hypothetical protein
MIAFLRYRNDAIELRMQYHAGVVEALRRLPRPLRRWHKERKVWLLDPSLEDWLLRTLSTHGVGVHWLPEERSAASLEPWKTLWLLPGAPREVAEASYKALARLHHPDLVPPERKAEATRTMQQLNAAIEQIRALAERR